MKLQNTIIEQLCNNILGWIRPGNKIGLVDEIFNFRSTGDLKNLRKVAKREALLQKGWCSLLMDMVENSTSEALAEVMSAGIRPDFLGSNKQTILHLLFILPQEKASLILNYAHHLDVFDMFGDTPLMCASHGLVRVIDGDDVFGKSEAYDRFSAERVAAAELLMHHGASLNIQNEKGYTALMRAVGSPMLTQCLIRHGAAVNVQDLEGATALHHCVTVNATPSHLHESAKLLIQAGARADLKDREGRSPADLARLLSQSAFVDLLDACEASHKALSVLNDCDVGKSLKPL